MMEAFAVIQSVVSNPIFQLASIGMNALGAIQQGNTASANYKAQAAAANYNAQVSANQATQALQVATAEQLAHRRKVNQLQGVQRAGIAQSGTGFGGSNADILEQSGTLAELDALTLAYSGNLKAQGFTNQAALDTYQAGAYLNTAGRARTAGYLNAARVGADGLIRAFGKPEAPQPKSILDRGSFYGLRPGGGIGLKFS